MMPKKEWNKIVGADIRRKRMRLGLSQSVVAHVLEMDQSALSRIEAGKQELSAYEFTMIANMLFPKRPSQLTNIGRPQKPKQTREQQPKEKVIKGHGQAPRLGQP